jgi:hypothetical protein
MSKPEQPDQPLQPRHIAGRPAQPEAWGPPRSKVTDGAGRLVATATSNCLILSSA